VLRVSRGGSMPESARPKPCLPCGSGCSCSHAAERAAGGARPWPSRSGSDPSPAPCIGRRYRLPRRGRAPDRTGARAPATRGERELRAQLGRAAAPACESALCVQDPPPAPPGAVPSARRAPPAGAVRGSDHVPGEPGVRKGTASTRRVTLAAQSADGPQADAASADRQPEVTAPLAPGATWPARPELAQRFLRAGVATPQHARRAMQGCRSRMCRGQESARPRGRAAARGALIWRTAGCRGSHQERTCEHRASGSRRTSQALLLRPGVCSAGPGAGLCARYCEGIASCHRCARSRGCLGRCSDVLAGVGNLARSPWTTLPPPLQEWAQASNRQAPRTSLAANVAEAASRPRTSHRRQCVRWSVHRGSAPLA